MFQLGFSGFRVLTSSEIANDLKSCEKDSKIATHKQDGSRDKDRDRDRDREKISSGMVQRSLRPPCAPESTLYKKIQRYFHWASDPALVTADLSAYRAVVAQLHAELLELDMEEIRWRASINTVRAEFSNMESSLSSQVWRQEALAAELRGVLLREVAAVEALFGGGGGGDEHHTRGKGASLSVEDVAGRLASFDAALTGRMHACMAYSQGEGEGGIFAATDPSTGEVLLCSYRPRAVETEEVREEAAEVAMEVVNSVFDEATADSGAQAEQVVEPQSLGEVPLLQTIVTYVEERKRKIEEMTAADLFSEALLQGDGPLPSDRERPHNYFKAKRMQSAIPPTCDRQRTEVEALAAAAQYSAAPLSAFMGLLQHPYKQGALEGLGVCAPPPPVASVGSTSKGRGKTTSTINGHGGQVVMRMDAMRRTPCDVPLFLSPFSKLEGWYAGTYQALQFPLPPEQAGSPPNAACDIDIAGQEGASSHPSFIRQGEGLVAVINTLSSATQRAQVELADLLREEAEWRTQAGASALALLRAQEALGAVQEGWRGQGQGNNFSATLDPGAGGSSGDSAGGAAGVGTAGAGAGQISSSEHDGLLGLLGMGEVPGLESNGVNSAANKKLLESKKNAAKKKAAARRRR